MIFEDWFKSYFGEHMVNLESYHTACRDAWQAATVAEREGCIQICNEMSDGICAGGDWTALGAVEECADSIRDRYKKR